MIWGKVGRSGRPAFASRTDRATIVAALQYLGGNRVVGEGQAAGLEIFYPAPQVGQIPDDHEA